MAQITITGNLLDPTGTAVVGAPVAFELVNTAGNVPYVSGTNIVVQQKVTVVTIAGGAFTAQIQGNDTITPANTFYKVTFNNNQVNYYSFTGTNPINLNSTPSINLPPAPSSPSIFQGNNTWTGQNIFTLALNAVLQMLTLQVVSASGAPFEYIFPTLDGGAHAWTGSLPSIPSFLMLASTDSTICSVPLARPVSANYGKLLFIHDATGVSGSIVTCTNGLIVTEGSTNKSTATFNGTGWLLLLAEGISWVVIYSTGVVFA